MNKSNDIPSFIQESKENSLNVSNSDMYIQINKTKIPTINVFRNKYRDYVISISKVITLNNKSFEKYRYQPKTLCLDLYNNINLWYVILWLNDMTSIKEFNKKEIRIINPNNIDDLYKIVGMEEEKLTINHNDPDIINTIKE